MQTSSFGFFCVSACGAAARFVARLNVPDFARCTAGRDGAGILMQRVAPGARLACCRPNLELCGAAQGLAPARPRHGPGSGRRRPSITGHAQPNPAPLRSVPRRRQAVQLSQGGPCRPCPTLASLRICTRRLSVIKLACGAHGAALHVGHYTCTRALRRVLLSPNGTGPLAAAGCARVHANARHGSVEAERLPTLRPAGPRKAGQGRLRGSLRDAHHVFLFSAVPGTTAGTLDQGLNVGTNLPDMTSSSCRTWCRRRPRGL